jgi:hypothetical protein
LKRELPDVHVLIKLLNEHDVRYVVTGSAAALLYGIVLEPGDLDITPARDHDNLSRLACVLRLIDARQYRDAPFGQWEIGEDGEQHWVQRHATPEDIAARDAWEPDAADPKSFDHLLRSKYGAIDIVPEVCGTYEELMPRASRLALEDGQVVFVEAIKDLLATLTVPRREKDRARVRQLRALQRSRDIA